MTALAGTLYSSAFVATLYSSAFVATLYSSAFVAAPSASLLVNKLQSLILMIMTLCADDGLFSYRPKLVMWF